MVVASSPAAGSTRARILYQLLMACAQKRICITTPYFLPDRSAWKAMQKAVRDRARGGLHPDTGEAVGSSD